MKLSDLKTGEKAVIVKILGHGGFRKRIIEMGFIKGKLVKVLLNGDEPVTRPKSKLPKEFNLLTQQLSTFFQTKVQLTCSDKGKGKITIPFSNEEELERIMVLFDGMKKR